MQARAQGALGLRILRGVRAGAAGRGGAAGVGIGGQDGPALGRRRRRVQARAQGALELGILRGVKWPPKAHDVTVTYDHRAASALQQSRWRKDAPAAVHPLRCDGDDGCDEVEEENDGADFGGQLRAASAMLVQLKWCLFV